MNAKKARQFVRGIDEISLLQKNINKLIKERKWYIKLCEEIMQNCDWDNLATKRLELITQKDTIRSFDNKLREQKEKIKLLQRGLSHLQGRLKINPKVTFIICENK
jgi:predicted RNase H-like nuclease (RuvC/YqgF family)